MEELALELDSRRRIFEGVCKYPGTHLREIGRIVGLSTNLVDYHLIYLEKRGLVHSRQEGQYKRYFPSDSAVTGASSNMISAPDKTIVSLLRKQGPFRITLLILRHGKMTHGEITNMIGKSPSTISHYLGQLVKAGVVSKPSGAAEYTLRDPESVERILLRFNPQPETLTDGFIEIWDDLVL